MLFFSYNAKMYRVLIMIKYQQIKLQNILLSVINNYHLPLILDIKLY